MLILVMIMTIIIIIMIKNTHACACSSPRMNMETHHMMDMMECTTAYAILDAAILKGRLGLRTCINYM